MFTLYMQWDAKRKLAPGDIQFILTPREALEMASIFYELDYLEYDQSHPLSKHCVPKRRQGFTTATRHSPTNVSAGVNMTASMTK